MGCRFYLFLFVIYWETERELCKKCRAVQNMHSLFLNILPPVLQLQAKLFGFGLEGGKDNSGLLQIIQTVQTPKSVQNGQGIACFVRRIVSGIELVKISIISAIYIGIPVRFVF